MQILPFLIVENLIGSERHMLDALLVANEIIDDWHTNQK